MNVLKGAGLFLVFVVTMFVGSHVYQAMEDVAKSERVHASTTDILIDELNQTRRMSKPWPPKRGHDEERARWRDSISQVVVKELPDASAELCDPVRKEKIIGRMNEYFDRKLTTIRYPLHAAGESEARSAEMAWLTSIAAQAEDKIIALLQSGYIRVRDLRRGYLSEARRLLGETSPPAPECPA
jgi:hypothetical protein